VVTGDVPRSSLRRVQTPQGFDRATLVAAYGRVPGAAAEFTDDASVVRAAGVPVRVVDGDERAAKITVAHDLALAELAVQATAARASQGSAGEREAERPRRRPMTSTEERDDPGVEP
jgi:2-C-methyl-D-erythritol 4-phosphate cytidylyltransferase